MSLKLPLKYKFFKIVSATYWKNKIKFIKKSWGGCHDVLKIYDAQSLVHTYCQILADYLTLSQQGRLSPPYVFQN